MIDTLHGIISPYWPVHLMANHHWDLPNNFDAFSLDVNYLFNNLNNLILT